MPGSNDSSKGNGASKRMTNAHRKLKWGKSAARRTKRLEAASAVVKAAEARNREIRRNAANVAGGLSVNSDVDLLTPWERSKAERAERRRAAGLAEKHAAEVKAENRRKAAQRGNQTGPARGRKRRSKSSAVPAAA